MQHTLWTSADTTQLKAFGSYNYIDQNYRTPERLYNVEFNRDWNLEQVQGTQRLFELGGSITQPNVGFANYSLNWLSYGALACQDQQHAHYPDACHGQTVVRGIPKPLAHSAKP